MSTLEVPNNYKNLLLQIKNTFVEGQSVAVKMVRRQMVLTYWAIGKKHR
jgi:hypothetical protein